MSRTAIREKESQFPDRILWNMIKDYIKGNLDDNRFLYRAFVVEVDTVGGNLSDEDEPKNPPNSIRARIITNSRDAFITDPEELPVYWPMFPFDVTPIKPSEHVYVVFEDERKEHGLWLTRCAESFEFENKNIVPGKKKYGDISEREAQDTDQQDLASKSPDEFDNNPDVEYKKFVARVGDRVIEGSNNALIVLGRDRPKDAPGGEKGEAGTIDIVVGRSDKNDMNFEADASRIYISAKTNIDDNLGTDGSAASVKAIGLKSDHIRIFAREELRIKVKDFEMVIEPNGKMTIKAPGDIKIETDGKAEIIAKGDAKVEATGNSTVKGATVITDGITKIGGTGAAQSLVVGPMLVTLLTQVLTAIQNGPIGDLAGIPIPTHGGVAGQMGGFIGQLNTILSTKHFIDS